MNEIEIASFQWWAGATVGELQAANKRLAVSLERWRMVALQAYNSISDDASRELIGKQMDELEKNG